MGFDTTVLIAQQNAILNGLITTVTLAWIATGLSLLLGILTATADKTAPPIARWIFRSYIQLFRNTPLLIQIYVFYKALPAVGIVLPPFTCGVLALSLQSGAYMAEIFRTGLEAIPREQLESGLSLGFSRARTYLTLILPQAIRIILPPTGNQIIGLLKNTSLVSLITVPDLFFVVFKGGADQFRYLEFFTLGIALYMGLTLAISGLFWLLERQWAYRKTEAISCA